MRSWVNGIFIHHAREHLVALSRLPPYNLAFADVANQLALYIEEDEDLGIVPSAAMAKDHTLADKVDGKTNTLVAFESG